MSSRGCRSSRRRSRRVERPDHDAGAVITATVMHCLARDTRGAGLERHEAGSRVAELRGALLPRRACVADLLRRDASTLKAQAGSTLRGRLAARTEPDLALARRRLHRGVAVISCHALRAQARLARAGERRADAAEHDVVRGGRLLAVEARHALVIPHARFAQRDAPLAGDSPGSVTVTTFAHGVGAAASELEPKRLPAVKSCSMSLHDADEIHWLQAAPLLSS
jgi:hypothetical protein